MSLKHEAIILVGGQGTRLSSVVSHVPKPLAPVNEVPFLDYILRQLDLTGRIGKVILATGHQASLVHERYLSHPYGFDIIFSEEKIPLGTGGAVRQAFEKIDSEYAFVLNGDSFVAMDFGIFIDSCESRRKNTVLLVSVPDASRFGAVVFGSDFRILSFEEKGKEGPGDINAGIYSLSKKDVSRWPLGDKLSLEKEVFPAWVAGGTSSGLFAFPTRHPFIDIGTPESYREVADFFKRIGKKIGD